MVFDFLLQGFGAPPKLQEGIVGISDMNANIPGSVLSIDGTSAQSQNVSTLHHLENAGSDTSTTPHRTPTKTSGHRVSMVHHVESLGRVVGKPTKMDETSDSRASNESTGPQNIQFGLPASAINVEVSKNNNANLKHPRTTRRIVSSLRSRASHKSAVSDTRQPSGSTFNEANETIVRNLTESTEPSLSNDRKSMAEKVSHFDNFSMFNANHSREDSLTGAMQDRIDPPREGGQTESGRGVVRNSNKSEVPESILPAHDPSDCISNSDSDAHTKTTPANPTVDDVGVDTSKRLSPSKGDKVQNNQSVRRSSRMRRPSKKVQEDYSYFANVMEGGVVFDSGSVFCDAKQDAQPITALNDHVNPISEASDEERKKAVSKTTGKGTQKVETNDDLKGSKMDDRQMRVRRKRQSQTNNGTKPDKESSTPNPMSEASLDPKKIQDGMDSHGKKSDDVNGQGLGVLEALKVELQNPISKSTSEDCDPVKIVTKKRGKRKAPANSKEIEAGVVQSQNNTASKPRGEGFGTDDDNTKKRIKREVRGKDKELEEQGEISPSPGLVQNRSSQSTKAPTRNSTRKRIPVDRFAPIVKDFDDDASLHEEHGTTKKAEANDAMEFPGTRDGDIAGTLSEHSNEDQGVVQPQNNTISQSRGEGFGTDDDKAKKRTKREVRSKDKELEEQGEISPSPGLVLKGSSQLTKAPTRNSTRKRIPVDRFAPIVKDFDDDASLHETHSTNKKVKSNDAVELPGTRGGGIAGTRSQHSKKDPKVKKAKKMSPKMKGKQDWEEKVESSKDEVVAISAEVSTGNQPPKTGGDQDGADDIRRFKEEAAATEPEALVNGAPPKARSDAGYPTSRHPFLLQRDPNPTYIEEIAHLYHNPPLPSDETNGVLPRDLQKIPPPPQVPKPPSTGMCSWTYDELHRVYLGVFEPPEIITCGLHPVDKEFLLSLLERNDIAVITEGLLDWNMLNPDIWNLDNILNEGSYEFSHKIRRFDKVTDASGVESVVECDGFYSMRLVDYVKYLNHRQQSYQEGPATPKTFSWTDFKGVEKSVDVQVSALYLVDVDITKYLPGVAEDFRKAFRLESILPGGQDCMMSQVPRDARPTMGPNMYVTPSSSFTHFHQDGHGSVDSGHLVISGYNEVVMLRRLTERHKRHALWILTGKTSPGDKASQKYFDGLYSEPHEDGLGPKPSWPSPSLIQECRDMGYCPSVFILKPGQHLHINKGRLHAFRKMTTAQLPESDCHSTLRANLIREKEITTEQLCVSIAWDWMFRGKTPRGINREIVVALEASTLNRKKGKLSLGIPEISLLRMAQTFSTPLAQGSGTLGNFAKVDNRSCEKDHSAICRGILPGLRHVISGHIATMDAATCKQDSLERGERISFASRPNSWENPATFGIDPYGNEDFACKLCSKELSNIYFHCDGCEKLLSKDFNICADCYNEKRYMMNVKMHPHNPKKHATINHTGGMRFDRNSRCPCKNGPCCHDCGYCLGCSCRCHTWFTLNYRFFKKDAEEDLLRKVEVMAQKWKEDKDADEYLDNPEYVSRRLLESCSCW